MGGSKQTQTTETNPWQPAVPVLQNILSQAQGLATPGMFTPEFGSSIGAFSNFGNGTSQTAAAAQPVVGGSARGYGAGLDELMATANGSRLNSNPYLDAALKSAGQRTADAVNAQFSGAGRYGSGAHTGVLTDRIGQLETNARMQNYETGRGQQLNAANTLMSGGFQGVNAAAMADQAQLPREQAKIQAAQLSDQNANAARMAPVTALDWLRGNATQIGSMGQQGTTVSKTSANPLGMALGGLSMLGSFGMGAPLFGGLGGLGGTAMMGPGSYYG